MLKEYSRRKLHRGIYLLSAINYGNCHEANKPVDPPGTTNTRLSLEDPELIKLHVLLQPVCHSNTCKPSTRHHYWVIRVAFALVITVDAVDLVAQLLSEWRVHILGRHFHYQSWDMTTRGKQQAQKHKIEDAETPK
jgi:hypothetical protein